MTQPEGEKWEGNANLRIQNKLLTELMQKEKEIEELKKLLKEKENQNGAAGTTNRHAG